MTKTLRSNSTAATDKVAKKQKTQPQTEDSNMTTAVVSIEGSDPSMVSQDEMTNMLKLKEQMRKMVQQEMQKMVQQHMEQMQKMVQQQMEAIMERAQKIDERVQQQTEGIMERAQKIDERLQSVQEKLPGDVREVKTSVAESDLTGDDNSTYAEYVEWSKKREAAYEDSNAPKTCEAADSLNENQTNNNNIAFDELKKRVDYTYEKEFGEELRALFTDQTKGSHNK